MVHNYDTTKGLYPGEEGYQEWTGWEEQFKIPGTTFKRYNPIHPLTFHSKLLKNHQLLHSRKKKGEAYTDYKIRCNGELERNNRYFQPKDWTFDKLLYNYDLLYHIKIKGTELDEEYIKALKDHIQFIYKTYKVNIQHRVKPGDLD
jgi:hypothetical protein|tara:strand:+ start:97 stop:534 length:438 start_codon:yes stop_codon:yes gene_type:complete